MIGLVVYQLSPLLDRQRIDFDLILSDFWSDVPQVDLSNNSDVGPLHCILSIQSNSFRL